MSPGARVQQAGEVDAQLIVPGQPQPNILATGVSKAGVAGSNPAGGTNVSAVQTVFSRVPKSRWLSGAIQFPRLGGCYRREARVLALVLDRSYVQAENFSKFIEAAQCVSERGLYEAFGFGAVNPL
jgi:hypothetical protein